MWKTVSLSTGIAELGGWEHTNLKVSAAILTPHEENLPRNTVNKEKKKKSQKQEKKFPITLFEPLDTAIPEAETVDTLCLDYFHCRANKFFQPMERQINIIYLDSLS